jgi:hypothetical protein
VFESCVGLRLAVETGRVPRDLLSARGQGVIWMLTMYPKNVAENISLRLLQQIRKEAEDV